MVYIHSNSSLIFVCKIMKKSLSIFIAFFILISGMHLSMATHFCGGEVAAVKWSFSREIATCGMEESPKKATRQETLSSNCCRDILTVYAVDTNYPFSKIISEKVFQSISHVFFVPENRLFVLTRYPFPIHTNVYPPGFFQVNNVHLPDICVFRI